MGRNKILLVFALFKLLPFELADLLDVGEFTLESLLSLVVDVLDVGDILRSFLVRMVVNLEGTIAPQERGVGLLVVLFRDHVPVESVAYQLANRGGLGWRQLRLRGKHVLLPLTCGTGIVLSGDRTVLSSGGSDGVAEGSIIAVFDHLLETLRVGAVMDQRLELVWFYVLDS